MSNPVTLANAKTYLRSPAGSAEDAIIQLLLDSAADFVAQQCGVAFGVASYTDILNGGNVSLRTLVGPVVTITSIEDFSSEIETVADDMYHVIGTSPNDRIIWTGSSASTRAWVFPLLGSVSGTGQPMQNWPAGSGRWVVRYTGGYADGSCPATLQLAILDLTARAYANRGGVSSESSAGASVSFDKFWDADFAKRIDAYYRGKRF